MIAPVNSRRGNSGFVLIAVLTVLALLSAMVVVLTGMSRDSVDAALLSGTDTRQAALAQSGLSIAAYELFQLGLPAGRIKNQQFRLNEGIVTLTVTTDAGKVDLNASGKDLLAGAYIAAGLTALSPQAFAGRVIDWRDSDDKNSENGAEAAAYVEARLDHGPRNGPFRTVNDLRWVMGLSGADIEALRPFVTVYNPRGRLNTYAASPGLIAALPRIDPSIVDDVLAARVKFDGSSSAILDDLLLVQAALIDTVLPVTYRVDLQLLPKGTSKPRHAEVVISAGSLPIIPFHVLHWSGDR